MAGLGRRVAEHLHEAPAAVDLEPAGPRYAAQLRLEELLDTLLADLVALSVALALVDLELGLVDRGDVADEVRGEVAVRVVARRPAAGLHPREQLRVLLDVDEAVEVHLLGDDDRLVGREPGAAQVVEHRLLRPEKHPGQVRGRDVGLLRRQPALRP